MTPKEIAYKYALHARLNVLYFGSLIDHAKSTDTGLRGFALGCAVFSAVIPDNTARICCGVLAAGLLLIQILLNLRSLLVSASHMVERYTMVYQIFEELSLKDEVAQEELAPAVAVFAHSQTVEATMALTIDRSLLMAAERQLYRELGLPAESSGLISRLAP